MSKNQMNFINEENLLVQPDYLYSYIASAHMGVIRKWIQNGRKESPQEVIETTISLIIPLELTPQNLKDYMIE